MTENSKPRFFYGYVIVAIAFLVMAIMAGTQYSFGVFFKPLLTEFGWTRAMTSGAYSLYMVLHGLLYIVTGKLNDRFGPKVVMTACGVLMGIGYFLMSQISTVWQLYLVYGVIIAMGMSGGYVPLISTVARWFVKRRGLMTGMAVAGIGAGTVVVPPAASWLIANYGWRTSYIVVGSFALVLVILGAQFIRREPGEMGLAPYGDNEAPAKRAGLRAQGLTINEAFHTGKFWIFAALCVAHGFADQAIMVHIVAHATDLGVSAVIAANIMAVIGIFSVTGRVVMGSASDRIGNRNSLAISFTLTAVALLWLLAAKETWMLYQFAIIFGFGYGGFVALQSPVVAELFGLRSHGVILGVTTFSVTVGGSIGPALAGYIFDVTDSYQIAFLAGAVVSITAIVLSLKIRPTDKLILQAAPQKK